MSTDQVAYAVFPDRGNFEAALEALRAAGFRNSDISAILPERDRTTKDLAHEINSRRLKARSPAQEQARRSVVFLDGSSGSVLWRFRASVRSSRQGRLLRRWLAPARLARPEAWSAA